ncbi:hypothetical protein LVX13_12900 [Streptomyces albulus]|uniref:hypothetical protein n=1 Tax=Streptomyces noursei TaxID=1971 RepID=UPI001F16384A|nr:hypothetical protein [Streptomyces noursei]MCE4944015.1 hypothetical protein [Streptomyces noursei]
MWLIGLSHFVLSSLASGLSWNVESLIVFRVAQGFGGGMLDPIMLTVLATAAEPALAGRVMGLMGLMGIVIPLAPVLGRLDVIGLALLGPAFAVLVFALSQATGNAGFGAPPVRTALILGSLLLTGVGLGLIGAPTMGALYRTLPQDAVPQGTAALYIINQLGASLGAAVVALILQGQTNAGRTQVAAFQDASRWVLAAALAVLLTGFFLPGKKATVAAAEGSTAPRNGTNYAEESSN